VPYRNHTKISPPHPLPLFLNKKVIKKRLWENNVTHLGSKTSHQYSKTISID
jgi:hypothetical protein